MVIKINKILKSSNKLPKLLKDWGDNFNSRGINHYVGVRF